MAEGLLRRALDERGVDVGVSSAGLLTDGEPATETAVDTLAVRGIDLDDHRSRRISSDLLGRADVIVGMTREHVREVAVLRPDLYARTFTLKELVRRGRVAGPRGAGESVADWVARLARGRLPKDHLGASTVDDVADPVGQGGRVYEQTADELDGLTAALVDLLWPEATASVTAEATA
jgi:protein-tyrosine phosphatase